MDISLAILVTFSELLNLIKVIEKDLKIPFELYLFMVITHQILLN